MYPKTKFDMLQKGMVGVLCITVAVLLTTSSINASNIYTFTNITNNNPEDVASQLQVDVMDTGGGQVSFTFTNSVGTPSSVRQIYFDDDGGNLQNLVITNSGSPAPRFDVNEPLNPGDLPSGNPQGFSADAALSAASQNGPPSNGLNGGAGEATTFTYDLIGGKTFADVIADLDNQVLRIGLHVQSIGAGGGSDSFLNNGPPGGGNPVPEPNTLALVGLGLGVIAMRYRKKTKK